MDSLEELSATLEAAEAYLGALAAKELPWPAFRDAELVARRHAERLLASGPQDEAVRAPRGEVRSDGEPPLVADIAEAAVLEPDVVDSADPGLGDDDDLVIELTEDESLDLDADLSFELDDGSVGQQPAALSGPDAPLEAMAEDDTPLVDFDDDTPLVDFDDDPVSADESDGSDSLVAFSDDDFVVFDEAADSPPEAESSGEEALVDDLSSLISIDDEPVARVGYIAYDDDGNVVEEDDGGAHESAAPSPEADDLDRFVSWSDEPVAEDESDIAPAPPPGDEEQPDEAAEDTLALDSDFIDTLSDDTRESSSDDDALGVLDAELFVDDGESEPADSLDVLDDELEEAFADEEDPFMADVGDLDRLRRQAAGQSSAASASPDNAGRQASPDAGRPVTAGLYGGPSLPTIREGHEAKPRAAAIQINAAAGTGKVIGLDEEDEPIAIGDVGDYGEDDDEDYEDEDSAGGFRVSLQAHDDDDEYEYVDDDEDDEAASAEPEPVVLAPAEIDPSQAEVDALFERAESAASAGEMQTGADLYSDVIDLDPDHHRAFVGRGRLYLDLGDYTRAMSDFMTAEDLAPTDPEPQIAIGDLYFARKDYRKAISHFNQALEVAPDHAMAFCRRGISHYYRKNYPQGMEDLMRARKLDEDIPNIDTYIAMARKKAKR